MSESTSEDDVADGLNAETPTAEADETTDESTHRRADDTNHTRTLFVAFGVLAAFFAMGWGSIPLYRLVCKSLDPGGSTASIGTADKYENVEVDKSRTVSVRFTTNVVDELNWGFRRLNPSLTVHPGEKSMVKFVARNHEDRPVTAKATYDINPPEAAQAFKKIECFCFKQQTLEAGERQEMPLVFWLEPEKLPDDVERVTLGYTFFEAEHASPEGADKQAAAGR